MPVPMAADSRHPSHQSAVATSTPVSSMSTATTYSRNSRNEPNWSPITSAKHTDDTVAGDRSVVKAAAKPDYGWIKQICGTWLCGECTTIHAYCITHQVGTQHNYIDGLGFIVPV